MKEKKINLNLSEMAEGGIQEKLDLELQKVLDNIQDLNTEAGAKRKITLTLEFKPDDNREIIATTSAFKTTLAPTVGVATTILTGRNENTGMIEASELKSRVKGQMYMDPEDSVVKTDTGVPVEQLEKESQVLDLQKLKQERG